MFTAEAGVKSKFCSAIESFSILVKHKIKILSRNRHFGQKSKLCSKIEILFKNRNCPEIDILVKNQNLVRQSIFCKEIELVTNRNFVKIKFKKGYLPGHMANCFKLAKKDRKIYRTCGRIASGSSRSMSFGPL